MTVISFQGQFAEAVDQRRKKQTIRAGKRQWRVGDILHLYSGGYRKGERRRKLAGAETPRITKVRRITIRRGSVRVDGDFWNDREIARLAEDDGFASVTDFMDYFVPEPMGTFEGTLIHWEWP